MPVGRADPLVLRAGSPLIGTVVLQLVQAGDELRIPIESPIAIAARFRVFVAHDAAQKQEAARRQAQIHERLLSLSRGSESRPGSHILGYADTPEAHSLIGTAEEVAEGLAALEKVGVAYVLLFGQG